METAFPPDIVLFLARVAFGYTMFFFGVPKLLNLKEVAKEFTNKGFKPGRFWGTLMALTEVFGGLSVILGIYPEIGAILIAYTMIVGTFWKLKKSKGFSQWSYDLLILALAFVGLFIGFGAYTIVHFDLPTITTGHVVIAVIIGGINAYLPELLGKKYQHWKA